MNVTLSREAEQFVEDKIASGKYRSADEVVLEGLRLLDQQEYARDVRQKIAAGAKSLDEGKGVPGDEAFARVREHIRRRATAGSSL